jgi:maltose O-acetyltransferase
MSIINRLLRLRGKANCTNDYSSSVFNVPVRLNGQGKVSLGKSISFGYKLAPIIGRGSITIQARYKESLIEIGDLVEFSNNITIIALSKISIGSRCLIADMVTIVDSDFHDISPLDRYSDLKRFNSDGLVASTFVEDNVWIGSRSIILKGVRIGTGSIIGAGSIVTNNIPPNVLACGVPAKITKILLSNNMT